jgi:hypothetical protein
MKLSDYCPSNGTLSLKNYATSQKNPWSENSISDVLLRSTLQSTKAHVRCYMCVFTKITKKRFLEPEDR